MEQEEPPVYRDNLGFQSATTASETVLEDKDDVSTNSCGLYYASLFILGFLFHSRGVALQFYGVI